MLDGCLQDPSKAVHGCGFDALRNRHMVSFRAPSNEQGAPHITDCLGRHVVKRYCQLLEETFSDMLVAGPEVLATARIASGHGSGDSFQTLARARERAVSIGRSAARHFFAVFIRPSVCHSGGDPTPGHYVAVLADVSAGCTAPSRLRIMDCAPQHSERTRVHEQVAADLASFYSTLQPSSVYGHGGLPPLEDMQSQAASEQGGQGHPLEQLLSADCIIFVLFSARLWASAVCIHFNQADVVHCDARLRIFIDIVSGRVKNRVWDELFESWSTPDRRPLSPLRTPDFAQMDEETPKACNRPTRKVTHSSDEALARSPILSARGPGSDARGPDPSPSRSHRTRRSPSRSPRTEPRRAPTVCR